MIFATSDSDLFFYFIGLAILLSSIIKAAKKAKKEQEEADLKRQKPEIWLRLKEMEHAERCQHHETARKAAGVGEFILRLFMKR